MNDAGKSPDFSQGDEFLDGLRETLGKRQRRRGALSMLASSALVLNLFLASFSVLRLEGDETLWEEYLLSQMDEFLPLESPEDLTAELYLDLLLDGDMELSLIVEELLGLDLDANWLLAINMEGTNHD